MRPSLARQLISFSVPWQARQLPACSRFLSLSRIAVKKSWIRAVLAVGVCLLCLFSSGLAPSAFAHASGQSYLYFQVGEETLTTYVSAPIKGLNEVLALNLPTDRNVGDSEIEPLLPKIRSYVEQHIDIECPPQACTLTYQRSDTIVTGGGQFLQLYYSIDGFETRPDALQVGYDVILADKSHFINFVLIDQNWKTGTFNAEANIVLSYDKAGVVKTLDLSGGSLFQGFSAIVKLGIEHIVEGIDHVLFLIALLLPSVVRRENGKWQPVGSFSTSFAYIVKIVTAFTVAHSITLGLATLQIVDLPSRLVESVIAASIGLAAVDIFYPIFKRRVWLIVFIFGLFHGFGFASVLGDLGVTSQYALLSLLAFNIGIELGQLAIIAVVFPLLYLLRKQILYPPLVLKAGGLLLGAISLYWLIERVFDINFRVLPMLQGLF
ncbi:MAG: HupE/UreJ family protein [Cyanobacteria bacterium J06631_9]